MACELPRITKCCCCIPIRIASLLIGYFSIVASCLTLAAVSWYIYRVAKFVEHNKTHPNPEHPSNEVNDVALSLYISFAYYQFVFVYNLVLGLILVIGVHTKKPRYLRFYCSATYFLFALAIALVVLTCVFMGFLATIPILKWAFTLLACLIVVRSTYLDMEEENKPRVYEMQNLYMPQQAPLMV